MSDQVFWSSVNHHGRIRIFSGDRMVGMVKP